MWIRRSELKRARTRGSRQERRNRRAFDASASSSQDSRTRNSLKNNTVRESDHLLALGAHSHALLREYGTLFQNILMQCQSAVDAYHDNADNRPQAYVASRGLSASDARQIERMARYGVELTERLRQHAEQPSTDLRRVDLRRIVDESLAAIDYLFGNSVRMDVRHDTSPHVVRATPHALCRVITTLAVRGVERMPRGGRLTMITTTEAHPMREHAQPVCEAPAACALDAGASAWVSLRVFDYPAADAPYVATDSSTIRGALRAAARTVHNFGGRMEFIRRSERIAGVRVLLPTQ